MNVTNAPSSEAAREEFTEKSTQLRLTVADDHEIFLRGLRGILSQAGFTVVAEATDGREAVRQAIELKPDVTILDIGMPLLNGIEAANEIIKSIPDVKIVLLTVHSEDRYVLEALHAGVRGYVLKSKAATQVINAIRDVHHGGIFLSPDVSRAIVDAYLEKTGYETLTPREMEVLRLVGEGKTTKEIAAILGVSVKTADTHRMNVMHKLDLHSSAELIHYSIRRGLVVP